MKLQRRVTMLMSVVVLLVAGTSALAKNSGTVKISYAASLTGTALTPGEYKVTWEQHSPEATVTLMRGKNVVATAQGKWVEREVRYPANAVLYNVNPDGSRTVMELRFAGLKGALVFSEASPKS
jgi:hypothetical protein